MWSEQNEDHWSGSVILSSQSSGTLSITNDNNNNYNCESKVKLKFN